MIHASESIEVSVSAHWINATLQVSLGRCFFLTCKIRSNIQRDYGSI